jgi:hypothetical protein
MEFRERHRSNWGTHALRMPRSRVPFQILRYQQKDKDIREDFSNDGTDSNRPLGLRCDSLVVKTQCDAVNI